MSNPVTPPPLATSIANDLDISGTPKSPKKRSRGRILPENFRSKFFRRRASFKDKSSGNLLSVPATPHSASSSLETLNLSSAIRSLHLGSPTRAASHEIAAANTQAPVYARRDSIAEEPLTRPVETASTPASPREEPLRRPLEDQSLQRFQDVPIVIAMDISGSTRDQVLSQESDAARKIYNVLTNQRERGDFIIPWDHRLREPVAPQSLSKLSDLHAGGTRPSVLMSEESVSVIRKSSCWILFTDGEIDAPEIRTFSNGIRRAELHGTSCIIVIFGFKTRKPIGCNVSVGLSMFSAAPHCLMLFQDIDTKKLFILQSKGAFNGLLPEGRKEIILDSSTSWEHLPQTRYEDLRDIKIPSPQILGADNILLQSNRIIDLQDIYDSNVDAETATEILNNDDNLKTLLLESQLRGQNDSVSTWIQNQKMKTQDILFIPRPDINLQAKYYIKLLLESSQSGLAKGENSRSEIETWQIALRAAHEANWASFASDAGLRGKLISRRSQVVTDAMSRIEMNIVQMDSRNSPCSAAMLAPVTPTSSVWNPQTPKTPMSEYQPDVQNPIEMDVLFIPGYRYDQGSASAAGLEGTCPLCNFPDSILSILLKDHPSDIQTAGFPAPNVRAGLSFPMAMGTFPETDILSPFVCCDACAYHLVQLQQSPYDEKILAAIPLIPAAISGNFRETTFSSIDEALKKRFERPAIEQVFLSIIYNTLESSDGEHSLIEKQALRWASSMISLHMSVPTTLSAFFSGHLSPRGYIPLPMALSQSLTSLAKPSPPLVQYPLPGFIVMVQAMVDMSLEPQPHARQRAVFLRVLFHFVEKLCEIYKSDSVYAIETLRSLLWRPQTTFEEEESATSITNQDPHPHWQPQPHSSSVPIYSLPIILLRDTYLISEYDWDALQRLGPLFDYVKDKCSCALAYFLHELEEQMPTSLTPMELFDRMREKRALSTMFEEPEKITEDIVCEAIQAFGEGNLSKVL